MGSTAIFCSYSAGSVRFTCLFFVYSFIYSFTRLIVYLLAGWLSGLRVCEFAGLPARGLASEHRIAVC